MISNDVKLIEDATYKLRVFTVFAAWRGVNNTWGLYALQSDSAWYVDLASGKLYSLLYDTITGLYATSDFDSGWTVQDLQLIKSPATDE